MSIVFPSRPRRYASPLDRNGGAVSKPPSASTSDLKRKKTPGLRLSDDFRVSNSQNGEREAVVKSDASADKTVKSDSEYYEEKDEPNLRAGPSVRHKQPQPAEDSDQQGSGDGVADVEGPDPETVNKTSDRIPPASRSDGGDRMGTTIEAKANEPMLRSNSGGGDGKGPPQTFHKRTPPEDFQETLRTSLRAIYRNLAFVLVLTCATNVLILAIPIYLFQISDRVLTSRSLDTLIMLTAIVAGAVIFQSAFDAVRRFMLMRTAVEVAARLGAPVLSAAAHASLHGTGREYQTLGDLQQVRGFLVSGTLISFLDVPFAPLFILMIFLVHPQLGMIVMVTAVLLMTIAFINQRMTAKPFAEANKAQSMANMHLDSMSRNSQIINAMAMIPEAVRIWGRDTAQSLTWQVRAQDRNVIFAAISRAVRLLTQIGILGWGAFLALQGEITGGMVIAASIIAGRAFAPIEGSIEGWNGFLLTRGAYGRINQLLSNSALQFEKLRLPRPEGRLDVERLLYVPGGTKRVVLNGISFSLNPGETLAIIGNSGAGKTTLGKTLVGSILPTSGSVRLDLMDIRNWDPRQFGESIGYLPQDVQLFPGTIKDNIGRMRDDATDEQIHDAAVLADVHNMIATLPQGYETVVAADGSPLSGGQKQRIALARAFFGNPRMVVLDEPNSNLDVAGDQALARAIAQARDSKITVVVITQKPTLLNVVDKIMLLTDGRVALFGQREQVLQQLNGSRSSQPGIQKK
ncbi:Type I secretion system ATP-binding protein PrsD [Ruegeria denitrificans]|uniref:Type I secretion system ATP-binding protein PrsD n=1 Tax=Ruegeria denitrificans TaxID=1715692 RepID=A0A0P1ICU4_9RHOB|nr:type I secretion system permease/ATPase [Ruegeria denitrificans]CUK05785.1 Type I secretion system ATP-binding protein PrsD [Ruegeria denitrificans]